MTDQNDGVVRRPYAALPAAEQRRARARFLDAGPQDGFLYELDVDGHVLCRRRAVKRAIPSATGGRVLVCADGSVEFDLYGTRRDIVFTGDGERA